VANRLARTGDSGRGSYKCFKDECIQHHPACVAFGATEPTSASLMFWVMVGDGAQRSLDSALPAFVQGEMKEGVENHVSSPPLRIN